VAKATVSRALRSLAAEGLVVARPRHGYLVALAAGEPDRGLPLTFVDSGVMPVGSGWDHFYTTLNAEFREVARRRGWSLLNVCAGDTTAAEVLGQITAANSCGTVSNTARLDLVESLRDAGVPTVLIDCESHDVPVDAVLQDNFRGGALAVRHLVERGHERIAWIGPDAADGPLHVVERLGGAMVEAARAGARLDPLVEAPLGVEERALEISRKLLALADRPRAIVCPWLDFTVALPRAARELGLEAGKDFDMVGWCTDEQRESGLLPWFRDAAPPPTVSWSIARMAEAAVARLKQRRAEPSLAAQTIRVPVRLRAGRGD
jgi:DNA-binding LacI/PurR family transcriptional regulator